jgi:anaerobic magnesium-protoporphyrin IX monomethyl ester cyclase
MRYLLILPFESPRGSFNFFGVAPPLGLLYLAKTLELQGDTVEILDFTAERFQEEMLIRALQSVDAVGINLMSTGISITKKIVGVIKEKDPDLPVIIGGPHCNLFPERSLEETTADICIQGDGEMIIPAVTRAIGSPDALSEIPGVYFRTNQTIHKGKPFQPLTDLDMIPFPARHLVKKYTYGWAYNPAIKKGEFASIMTSRGCPYHCNFCSRVAVSLNQFRIRSLENILEEFREIYQQGHKYTAIMDDAFLSNRTQAHAIFDAIIKENLDMTYYVTASRVDAADPELYKKMKRAGVVSIHYGLESGSQNVLDFYNKKTTVENNRDAVRFAHEAGLFTSGTFIIGAPFETKQQFDATVRFAESIPLDSVAFLPLKYMVGSELWKKALDEKKISSHEYFVCVDSQKNLGAFTEHDLMKYCRKAQWVFYSRPRYLYNLLKFSLQQNDFSLLKVFFAMLFSKMSSPISPSQLFFPRAEKANDGAETIL